MGVISACTYNEAVRARDQALQARGLAPKQARIAIIAWVVRVSYAVLRDGKPYEDAGRNQHSQQATAEAPVANVQLDHRREIVGPSQAVACPALQPIDCAPVAATITAPLLPAPPDRTTSCTSARHAQVARAADGLTKPEISGTGAGLTGARSTLVCMTESFDRMTHVSPRAQPPEQGRRMRVRAQHDSQRVCMPHKNAASAVETTVTDNLRGCGPSPLLETLNPADPHL